MPADRIILRGVDLAAFAVAFATRLRSRGLNVGFSEIADFAAALEQTAGIDRAGLYWRARITLVRREADLEVFDELFAVVFADAVLAVDPITRGSRPRPQEESFGSVRGDAVQEQAGCGLPWVTLPPVVAQAQDEPSPLTVPQRLPGRLAAVAPLPFEQLDEQQMRQLGGWLEATLRIWPTRRSRRSVEDRHGRRIAVRETIARSRRTGWEPMELVRASGRRRARRVVMVCDVSQSMQAQTVAYLHLMRALVLAADAEVFAFATELTRLTVVLRQHSAPAAVQRADERVVDRFGGTRIATSLQALLASHHANLLRGAVVIIASDGADSDPAPATAAAMARIRRRAHRVIWINPRAAAPGYEPRVATMAAALPYCHEFLPAESFASLGHVIDRIAGASGQRPVSSTGSHAPRAGTGRR